MEDRHKRCVDSIRNSVGKKKVLMLLSGGVNSTVCAALMREALPHEQVIAIHIDNGFMRKNESEQVAQSLEGININVRVEQASKEFLNGCTTIRKPVPIQHGRAVGDQSAMAPVYTSRKTDLLCFITNPEEKRMVIGDTFMMVANKVIDELNLNREEVMLGQGTLSP